MKCLIYIVLLLIPVIHLQAQHHPQRTPEDIARKQTGMLVRELGITDSIVQDTLYRLYLKYSRKREISHTRAEALQYMQEINTELQNILTPEQYQQFMNQQINHSPHAPRVHYNRITASPADTLPPPPSDNDEATNMPLQLPVSRL